jgi:uncharacterized protein (TIGR00297 family)
MNQTSAAGSQPPWVSTRKVVHVAMLGFAFLLPFLTWVEAAGCAVLALVFNLFVLPHLGVDLRKRTAAGLDADVRTGIVIYPLSVLGLIIFYPHHMEIVAGAWAIMALGDGAAGVAGTALGGPALPWNRAKTWSGFLAFVAAGTVGADALMRWVNPALDLERAALVAAAAALAGALVESLPIALDDNASVPLVCGALMFCLFQVRAWALAGNLPFLPRRLLVALGVNALLVLLALAARTVTRSGAAAGFLLGVAVYLGYGYKSYLILAAFFVLGSVATRLGYGRKAARGVAEKRRGARSWREALANTLAGAFLALMVITTPYPAIFLVALVASFAEAAGDTVSSEIGQWLSDRAYLITNFRRVEAGENGGVALPGSAAALLACAGVAGLGWGLGLTSGRGAGLAFAAAAAGNLLDSLLGATLERRGLVTNGIVNFAGTSFAAGLAFALAWHWGAL